MWVLLLLVAWAVTGLACARLCHAAVTAARSSGPPAAPATAEAPAPAGRTLTLYETAFLAGGPARVADLTLVAMARQRRMLLAHTGWATVVDPEGRDEIERSLIAALGPDGQSPVPRVRAAVTGAYPVRTLAERLTTAGLAVPAAVRTSIVAATRQVRAAAVLVLVTGLTAELLAGAGSGWDTVAPWFGLPFVLAVGCLALARHEIHTWSRWASPAGELRLRDGPAAEKDGDHALLRALALRGPGSLPQPELRQALGGARSPLRGH